MSINSIKNSIEAFILNADNDLLIIKGSWGVGKTYTWREIVSNARGKTIGKEHYAYVSVFGLDSVDAIKEKLMVSFVDSAKAHQTGKLAKAEEYGGKIITEVLKADWAKKLTGNVLQTMVFESLKNGLICFDDVERRGRNLDINQLFGFADFLKEARDCKIVFILNDSKLEERKDYETQKEKLARRELEFSITPAEAFDLIFKSTHPYFEVIKECCLTLAIRNIRTLQKIEHFVKELLIEVRGKEPSAIELVVRSLILFVWAYFDKEDDSITLEAIREHRLGRLHSKIANKKDVTDEEKKLGDLLMRYKRWYLTEIDLSLMEFVEKGYLDKVSFKKVFGDLNKRQIARKGNDDYAKAWDMYGETLTGTKVEFVDALVAGFDKNVDYIELSSLDSSVRVLRGLKENAKADVMIDLYLEKHREKFTPEFESTIHFTSVEDARLKAQIKNLISGFVYTFDFKETLENLSMNQYSTPQELAFLDSMRVDDYVDYFISVNSSGLHTYIKGCLDLENLPDPAGHRKSISAKTRKALKKIAATDELNKFKLNDWFPGRF